MDKVTGGAVVGTGCTNEPNLPTQTETGAGRRTHARSRPSGPLRQTNPICPAPARERSRTEGPDEPPTLSEHVKQSQFLAGVQGGRRCRCRRTETCETKPIHPKQNEEVSNLWHKSYDELDA
jgi:hypothetical protein